MSRIDKEYHKLLNKIQNEGFSYEDPNRKGIYRIQIPEYKFIHNFEDGFPAITTKKLFWKGVVGELLWFLRGDSDIKYLLDNNINIWNKDAYNFYLKSHIQEGATGTKEYSLDTFIKEAQVYKGIGNLGRIYGKQWREWRTPYIYEGDEFNSTDQIYNLIQNLKQKPMGTAHIVTAWNPAELDDMALPPCHWSFEILVEPIKRGKIIELLKEQGATWDIPITTERFLKLAHNRWKIPKYQFTLKWHQRSVDTFLGLPFNIASYALLAHMIGKVTNMVPKAIIGDLSNVHIYSNHMNAVKEQLTRKTTFIDSRCELKILNEINESFKSLDINHFKLIGYKHQGPITAEMIARDN